MNPVKDPDYEVCLVTFFDILGFRALLGRQSAAEIRETMSRFRRLSKGADVAPVRRMKEARVQSQVLAEIISDAIVRVRTTETQHQDGALIWEIIDLLHIQIECIDKGILLRGAMTVGEMHIGLQLDGPVFGPALVEAYEMEEREVIYPRIAIHDRLIAEHTANNTLWREGTDFAEEKRHLDRLLRRDEAGMYFIDYLSASFDEMDAGFAGWCAFMERHRSLVLSGLQSQTNFAVRRKYSWLRNYHNIVIREFLERVDPEALSEDHNALATDIISELQISD